MLSGTEPIGEALLEFFGGDAEGAAMVGAGDFPELSLRVEGVDTAGVAKRYVAVDLAVDQQDWDVGCGCGILRRDFIHLQVVFPAGAEEGNFD